MWESQAFAEPCPLDKSQLEALFDYLDTQGLFETAGGSVRSKCDHTYANTLAFLNARRIDAKPVIPWLGMHGAGCDCEVLMNTTMYYENAIELERGGP